MNLSDPALFRQQILIDGKWHEDADGAGARRRAQRHRRYLETKYVNLGGLG